MPDRASPGATQMSERSSLLFWFSAACACFYLGNVLGGRKQPEVDRFEAMVRLPELGVSAGNAGAIGQLPAGTFCYFRKKNDEDCEIFVNVKGPLLVADGYPCVPIGISRR
jgi:hypothetical protein